MIFPSDLPVLTHETACLDRLKELPSGRKIIGIAGPPGSGKSTVAKALTDALGPTSVLVPMDGWHLAPAELVRQGKRERMGAPDTFDPDGFAHLLHRLREGTDRVIYAPTFDRTVEQPIAGSIAVPGEVDVIIVEGNYLLYQDHGWAAVAEALDECWFLDVPAAERVRRLVQRRLSYGDNPEHAEAWVAEVDMPNAALVDATRARADAIVRLR